MKRLITTLVYLGLSCVPTSDAHKFVWTVDSGSPGFRVESSSRYDRWVICYLYRNEIRPSTILDGTYYASYAMYPDRLGYVFTGSPLRQPYAGFHYWAYCPDLEQVTTWGCSGQVILATVLQ